MNCDRHTEAKYLTRYLDGEWLLNTHVLKYNPAERIDSGLISNLINNRLSQLESECMSDEFYYLKIGFALIHFGQRGVAINIWHIGLWHSTYEFFCSNWYCYGRDYSNMELLDNAEPRFCHYEIPIVTTELENLQTIIASINCQEELESCFVNAYNDDLCLSS